ncbi:MULTISPECIES: hypothetical protein [Roseobacteraceae]|uniref:hypothetical protein n=1 Tax=Roseobacteraceae TaxID=2854170 RepID=UPI0032992499
MTAPLAHIRRHPRKGLGNNAVETADATPGQTVAGGRIWAIATYPKASACDIAVRTRHFDVSFKVHTAGTTSIGDTFQ